MCQATTGSYRQPLHCRERFGDQRLRFFLHSTEVVFLKEAFGVTLIHIFDAGGAGPNQGAE